MTSPPGTLTMSCGDPVTGGAIFVTLNFNVTTGAIQNVGSPAAALVCDNQTGRVCPVVVAGPSADFQVSVPIGVTRRTANQLASVGISNRSDVTEMSLAVPSS